MTLPAISDTKGWARQHRDDWQAIADNPRHPDDIRAMAAISAAEWDECVQHDCLGDCKRCDIEDCKDIVNELAGGADNDR